MQTTYATLSSPGRINDDFVIAAPTWIAVLDGATAPSGINSGCIHTVPWLVRHLGTELARLLTLTELPLADQLAHAIATVCVAHGDTCDLTNPDSPSSTVALLREHGDDIEYLILGDQTITLDTDDGLTTVTDDRTSRLSDYSLEGVRQARNTPDGFWVASTRPDAAYQAVTDSVPAKSLRRAAVLSDGAGRLVDRFGQLGWSDVLQLLDSDGPHELLRRTRVAEAADTSDERRRRRGKLHDDATVAYVTFHPPTHA